MKFKQVNFIFIMATFLEIQLHCNTSMEFYINRKVVAQFLHSTGWGLGCAGLAYAGQKILTPSHVLKKYCIYAGIAGFSGKYLYDYCNTPYTNDELFKLIINNPTTALKYLSKKKKPLVNATSFDNEKTQAMVEEIEKDCPIFLLNECIGETSAPCVLSRTYNPKFRSIFENSAVKALINKLDKNQSVNYVAFGSGGMFQDLVVIAKTLHQKPTANIAINLIDPLYRYYMQILDLQCSSRKVKIADENAPTSIHIDSIIESTNAVYKAPMNKKQKDKLKQKIKSDVFVLNKQSKQFISFLQERFPQSNISLFLHTSTDEYLNYLKTHQLSNPDVITAVDLEGGVTTGNDYLNLCLFGLENNPSSENFFLNKDPLNLTNVSIKDNGGRKIDLQDPLKHAPTITSYWRT